MGDEMHQMLEWRAKNQANNTGLWNEMVLDGEKMIQRLEVDPARVIPAIVYVPSLDAQAKTQAEEMAKAFQQQWHLPSPLPVIKVDTTVKVATGDPFVFEAEPLEV